MRSHLAKRIFEMCRDKSAKLAIWLKKSYFAILSLLSLCIDFKNSSGQMTSRSVLWKTYYTNFLKKCHISCPRLSMYLSEKINWIISSFPHRISIIVFCLGSLDDFGSMECRIGECSFFSDSILSLGSVNHFHFLLLIRFECKPLELDKQEW